MPAWSFSTIRPKLDHFFDNVRTSLEARAASGVDRRRLEEFLNQAQALKDRLYACLGGDDRSDLPAILKELQVLAYRTRVLFGSPLPGVAWDDLHHLLSTMPPVPAPAMRVLEGRPKAAFASGELKDVPRTAGSDRMRVATVPPLEGTELVGRAPLVFPEFTLTQDLPLAGAENQLAPAEADRGDAGADAEAGRAILAEAEPEAPLESPAAAESPRSGMPDVLAMPFRVPRLMDVLVFLLGTIAGYSLGGAPPSLTAVACGILAILVTRPAPVRYNEESP